MKLVITGSYEEFLDYCREQGLNPHSRPKTVVFVDDYNDFFGFSGAELVCYGEYQKNPIYQNEELWKFMLTYGKAKGWKMDENLLDRL